MCALRAGQGGGLKLTGHDCSHARDVSSDETQRQLHCASRGSCWCCSPLRPAHTITKSLSFSEQTCFFFLCNLYVNGLSQGFVGSEARLLQLLNAICAAENQ